jgi:hypothetical protein
MTLKELIEEARSDVDDEVEPYLWSDADWTRYLNDAENEACARAHLLVDSATPEICTIALEAGTGLYTLDARVLTVKRVKLASQAKPLTQTTRDTLDDKVWDWENRDGDPECFGSESRNELLLVPAPDAADTAYLTVARLPLAAMSDLDNHSPEIAAQYHRGLISWAISRAYLKNDEDTFNLKKSQVYEAKFALKFGYPVSAKAEQLRRRTPRNARVKWRPFGF